jgi:hypothetical protein
MYNYWVVLALELVFFSIWIFCSNSMLLTKYLVSSLFTLPWHLRGLADPNPRS